MFWSYWALLALLVRLGPFGHLGHLVLVGISFFMLVKIVLLFLFWFLSAPYKENMADFSKINPEFQTWIVINFSLFLRWLSNIKWMHRCYLGLEKIICSQSIVSSSRTDLCTDVSAGRVSWTGRLLLSLPSILSIFQPQIKSSRKICSFVNSVNFSTKRKSLPKRSAPLQQFYL